MNLVSRVAIGMTLLAGLYLTGPAQTFTAKTLSNEGSNPVPSAQLYGKLSPNPKEKGFNAEYVITIPTPILSIFGDETHMNGNHPTIFQYTPLKDKTPGRANEDRIVGRIFGSSELSCAPLYYEYIAMIEYVREDGFPKIQITASLNEDDKKLSDPRGVEIVKNEGLDTLGNVTTLLVEEFYTDRNGNRAVKTAYAYNVNDELLKKAECDVLPVQSYGVVSCVKNIIENSLIGNRQRIKRQVNIHYYLKNNPVMVTISRMKAGDYEYLKFEANNIPEDLLKSIGSMTFNFEPGPGKVPTWMKGETRGVLPSPSAQLKSAVVK